MARNTKYYTTIKALCLVIIVWLVLNTYIYSYGFQSVRTLEKKFENSAEPREKFIEAGNNNHTRNTAVVNRWKKVSICINIHYGNLAHQWLSSDCKLPV